MHCMDAKSQERLVKAYKEEKDPKVAARFLIVRFI